MFRAIINFFLNWLFLKFVNIKFEYSHPIIIDTGMPLVACAGCWLVLTVCKSKICWQKCKALPYILVGIKLIFDLYYA